MKSIGEHYSDAVGNHVTTVDYYGGGVDVIENEWKDGEYMVTQKMPEVRNISDKAGLRKAFHEAMTKVAILESLNYELDECDDGVAFWSKTISE